jgi:hypothetical protein
MTTTDQPYTLVVLDEQQRQQKQAIALARSNPTAAKQLIAWMSEQIPVWFPGDQEALAVSEQIAAIPLLIDKLDGLWMQASDQINYYRDLVIEVERQRDALAFEIDRRSTDIRDSLHREIKRDMTITLDDISEVDAEMFIDALRGNYTGELGTFTMLDIEAFVRRITDEITDAMHEDESEIDDDPE